MIHLALTLLALLFLMYVLVYLLPAFIVLGGVLLALGAAAVALYLWGPVIAVIALVVGVLYVTFRLLGRKPPKPRRTIRLESGTYELVGKL